jgi:hypothetical protein
MLRLFGGIAEFPENADETSLRDLSGQLGHQLDSRTPTVFMQGDPSIFLSAEAALLVGEES